MRFWHIIIASAVAATIVGGGLFLSGGVSPRGEVAPRLIAHWPGIAVVWLTSYAILALLLTTLAAFFKVGGNARERGWGYRLRDYFAQLAAAQYFTSVLALLALGLSRVPVDTVLFPVLPDPIGNSPALAACAAVVVIGLLGGLLLTAAIVIGDRPEMESSAPGIRASRLFGEAEEPPVPVTAEAAPDAVRPPLSIPAPVTTSVVVDSEQLVALIEQAQRPVLEAIKDLAASVNRLRRNLGELKFLLQERGSRRPEEPGGGSPSAGEEAEGQLRAVVAAVDASVARLGEMALLLSASETRAVAGRETPGSPAARSRLSAELQALLKELAPAADRGEPSR